MVKVSIVLPVRNGEKWVAACLDSILEQSYENFEVIAIDDGSEDGSASLLAEYMEKDARIKTITTKNRGVSSARNLGLEHSVGDYIRFVDCDDTLPKDSLKELVCAMEKNDTQLAIGPFCEISLGTRTKRTLMEQGGIFSRQEYLDYMRRYPRSFFYSVLWNKLYKREIIMEHAIRFDEAISWSEDFLFNIHYNERITSVAVLENSVYDYHHHISGLTSGFAKTVPRHPFASLKLLLYLFREYCRHCLNDGERKLCDYRAFFRGTHGS